MTDLLRVATAGSVDDGKSTLMGRLLHDSKNLLADQLAAVEAASRRRGLDATDLALLTDGLRAEREQGITIDVAYRYFATTQRSFILADTPGHVRYTRNMVTGASTADVAVVLVDARHGVVDQTRRHAAIAGLLRVGHLVLAVNKMDLVGFDQGRYDEIVGGFSEVSQALGITSTAAIPLSALGGDNVVHASPRMTWYGGATLLRHLEQLPAPRRDAGVGARLPVQIVVRPRTAAHPDYRAYAGRVAAGSLRVGDPITVLPSGDETTVTRIATYDGDVTHASTGRSVAVCLADELDVARGDLLAARDDAPTPVREVRGRVCVVADHRLRAGQRYRFRAGTRDLLAIVAEVEQRWDAASLEAVAADELGLNDLGRLVVRLAEPVAVDPYERSRGTGSFLLVDEVTAATVAAGMVA